jgi:bifunctional UDP-N-acetylglucosamine pyrophosphorylase/glucosamine-1-phosphate N-acetyltransferase
VNERHLLAGVSMADPSTAYVEASVELEPDVILEPNVFLRAPASARAGRRCGTRSSTRSSAATADRRERPRVVEVADEVTIGPFSPSPGSVIGRGAELGSYAEVKNSRLGRAPAAPHELPRRRRRRGGTNVGAGTITANYDGRRVADDVGEGVFLGVDSMLVAPLTIGDGAKTGAGAVVTRDVPPGKLAVGVPARMRDPRPVDGDTPRADDDGSGPDGDRAPDAGR